MKTQVKTTVVKKGEATLSNNKSPKEPSEKVVIDSLTVQLGFWKRECQYAEKDLSTARHEKEVLRAEVVRLKDAVKFYSVVAVCCFAFFAVLQVMMAIQSYRTAEVDRDIDIFAQENRNKRRVAQIREIVRKWAARERSVVPAGDSLLDLGTDGIVLRIQPTSRPVTKRSPSSSTEKCPSTPTDQSPLVTPPQDAQDRPLDRPLQEPLQRLPRL